MTILDVPGDIRVLRPWFNVIRRCRERAISGGYSVLTVTVVCDERGQPQHWLEPDVKHIEPCGSKTALERLMEGLAGNG